MIEQIKYTYEIAEKTKNKLNWGLVLYVCKNRDRIIISV